MKLFLLTVVGLIVLAQTRLWVGDRSIVSVWRLSEAIDAQRAENAELELRNRRLAAEVEDLRTGLDAVEERAREELGMIKRGETYYQVVP